VWIKVVKKGTNQPYIQTQLYYFWAHYINSYGLPVTEDVDLYAKAHDGGRNPESRNDYGDNKGAYTVTITHLESPCELSAHRFILSPTAVDKDGDGIPDAEEEGLLARFRPYYRFSRDHGTDELYAPVDPHIKHSELVAPRNATIVPMECAGTSQEYLSRSPASIIGKRCPAPFGLGSIGWTDILATPGRSDCKLHISESFRSGAPWKEVIAKRNVGLFGHVVPIADMDHPCAHSPGGPNANALLSTIIYSVSIMRRLLWMSVSATTRETGRSWSSPMIQIVIELKK
jgi:hypothetical protein